MKAALSFVRGEGGINRPLFTSRVANQDARERGKREQARGKEEQEKNGASKSSWACLVKVNR